MSDPLYHNKHMGRLYAEQDATLSDDERDRRHVNARIRLQEARQDHLEGNVAHYQAYLTRAYELLTSSLTPMQQRLYQRLKAYCAEHHVWCGDAAKLALFADLPYPFNPDIIYGLVKRGLIKNNAVNRFALTVEK
jgi:hypothetical protein